VTILLTSTGQLYLCGIIGPGRYQDNVPTHFQLGQNQSVPYTLQQLDSVCVLKACVTPTHAVVLTDRGEVAVFDDSSEIVPLPTKKQVAGIVDIAV
jgi:hypothetical protein